MEFLSPGWWSALAAIILIDLVLAGDNAIVIALAARALPPSLRRRAIIWGTIGAVGVRALMSVGAVWLLRLPGLQAVGGLALVWVAWSLAFGKEDDREKSHAMPAATSFWVAMRTIIVADALMGIDNVLGVAGTAHGAMDLVIIGLLASVPIVVFGSAFVLRMLERWPWLVKVGALVLVLTAVQMVWSDPLVRRVLA